jgi:Protein of unknown function (DUF2612)
MPTDYSEYVTSQHRDKPKFIETVKKYTGVISKLQDVTGDLPRAFDIDEAIGVQLDVIGIWIGLPRRIKVPILAYFTWNGTVANGWNNGVWRGIGDPTYGFYLLPDDLYRKLLKSKAIANRWDGSVDMAYDIIENATGVPGAVKIQDNQNMTMTLIITTALLPAIITTIIQQGYLLVKPCGVSVNYSLV